MAIWTAEFKDHSLLSKIEKLLFEFQYYVCMYILCMYVSIALFFHFLPIFWLNTISNGKAAFSFMYLSTILNLQKLI